MRPKRTAICEHCGTEFEIIRPHNANRFCSPACYHKNHSRESLSKRFYAKVAVSSPEECWEWTAHRLPNGYGTMSAGKRGLAPLYAHRVSYELHNGDIPDGMYVRHACDNPGCVNPAHLLIGTHEDNMSDMVSRGRAPRGSRQPNAKLREIDVRSIRRRWETGQVSQSQLGRKYGVSSSLIHKIVHRTAWKHVD